MFAATDSNFQWQSDVVNSRAPLEQRCVLKDK